MAQGFASQLRLLLWKNWLLQKRRKCISIFEVLLPVFFAAMLLLIRALVDRDEIKTITEYPYTSSVTNRSHLPTNVIIGYTPSNTATDQVMRTVLSLFGSYSPNIGPQTSMLMPFADENTAVTYLSANSDSDTLQHLVVFNSGLTSTSTSLPKRLDYDIRPDTGTQEWKTWQTSPFIRLNKPRDGKDGKFSRYPPYEKKAVMYMQRLVGEAVTRYHYSASGNSAADVIIDPQLRRFAYPPYIDDPMIRVIQGFLPLILVLSYILSVIVNTKNLVYEKEKKLKESMKLMGLRASVHWMSWFVTFMVYIIPAMAVYALLFVVDAGNGRILGNTSGSLFFVFLTVYALALVSFCFMVSTFVQKANVGAALAGILFFATYFPWYFVEPNYELLGAAPKLVSGLMFNTAMSLGVYVIGFHEGTGAGAQWDNIAEPATVSDNVSVLDFMVMMLLDTALHFLVTWYIDNVRPGEFGVPRPLYFPFTRSYWFGSAKPAGNHELEETEGYRFEKEPSGLNAGIQIKNLRKTFGPKVAVEGTNLNMYEGQISVLLGHNGAGKTTTMSMLTGFIPPSSGTALVNGYDICEDIVGVRRSLGLCPQHNILFDSMTVHEHLEFFARLKGADGSNLKAEVKETAIEVGLEAKIFTASSSLSGGQKRKLSVGIALIGGSRVVFLDEPTAGMDPGARRQTWNILQKAREGRTVVLSTHYMDEADLLGDRIAIMAEGVIKCCGSSMFLKKLYGAGYHLVVVKDENDSCDVQSLTNFIQTFVSTAELETVINREVSYLLPDNESNKFANLFRELESGKSKLGILSFGTSATTMEEVFLKVGDNADSLDHNKIGVADQNIHDDKVHCKTEQKGVEDQDFDIMDFNKGYRKLTGFSLELSRMRAIFVKKAIHTWRNRTVTLVQLLLPVIFTIIGLAAQEARPNRVNDPVLTFNLDDFSPSKVPYTAGHNPTPNGNNFANLYAKQFSSYRDVVNVDRNVENMTTWTVETIKSSGIASFSKEVIVGMELLTNNPTRGQNVSAAAYYNGEPNHAQPIAMNYLMNTYLQFYMGESYSLQSSINPLPNDTIKGKQQGSSARRNGFTVSLFISFGMAFLTTLFIFFLIKERESGAKHMQVVSGVGPFTYWVPTFLWDFINYIVPSMLLLVVFAAYDKKPYLGDGRFLITILVLAIYGFAVLPFMYALQFAFKSPPTGVVLVIMLNIVTGLVTQLAVAILAIPSLDTKDISDALDWLFKATFPNYNMAECFSRIYENYDNIEFCAQPLRAAICAKACQPDSAVCFKDNYLAWDVPGVGSYLVFMMLQALQYTVLVVLIEFHVFQRISYHLHGSPNDQQQDTASEYEKRADAAEDSDVAAERRRVNNITRASVDADDSLLLVNLFKRYKSCVAVRHICLGVPEHECFGLLGQNGAGKTSTFKMLTGDVMVTEGNAYLNGYDVRNNIKQAQAKMGYCPQFDALIDQMTGRETLNMYARLKGVPAENIPSVVDSLVDILTIRPHVDKMAGLYSGGNKRKLSTAIALVGDPPIVMLDEPSAGMDPAARRHLWNVLGKVRASGRTLVLTSHSMEECDALCTRIAIMVNGEFKCLGSPQHLKNKFGQGYTLIVQMGVLEDGTTAPILPVIDFIRHNFPGAKVFDDHQGYVHFQVPDTTQHIADVFELMESIKINLNVDDYSVHQTTLEQIFLTLTRSQVAPPEEVKQGICKRLCCRLCLLARASTEGERSGSPPHVDIHSPSPVQEGSNNVEETVGVAVCESLVDFEEVAASETQPTSRESSTDPEEM